MKGARAPLTLAVVAYVLVACAAAEEGIHSQYKSLARIDVTDEVGEGFGGRGEKVAGGPETTSDLAKDAGADAAGDAPALHKTHRQKNRKEKCEPRKRPVEDRCVYVRTHPACEQDDNLVHYLRLHYCAFGPSQSLVSHLTQAILIVLLCSVLATVAEQFFCPALANVARWLRLPEDVAGATLLSFGNGAPDVFTQVAALHNASAQGISLGIGAALGASFFVASAVFPIVALVAPAGNELRMRRAHSRGAADSDLDEEESFSRRTSEGELLSQSFGTTGDDYFFPAWCPSSVARLIGRLREIMSTGGVEIDPLPFFRDSVFYLVAVASIFGTLLRGSVSFAQACAICCVYVMYLMAVLLPRRIAAALNKWNGSADGMETPNEGYVTPPEEPSERRATTGLLDDVDGYTDSRGEPDSFDETVSDTDDSGVAARLLEVLRTPVLLMLKVTMPEIGKPLSRQSRWAVSLLPITTPLFFAAVARFLNDELITHPGVWFGVACGSVGSVALYLSWPAIVGASAPLGIAERFQKFLTVITFVQAVTWMDAAAGELVALFGAIGRISGASEALLGATVFAWGISIGDLVSDTTVARRGMAKTAIAACFGGPLFNLLVGLVGSMVFATVSRGVISGIKLENEIILLASCQLLAVTYLIVGIPFVHKGRVSRIAATGMLGFYVVTQVLIALTSGQVIFKDPWM